MSVETMIAIIERDARAEAAACLRDAEAEATRIVSEAQARVARRVGEALNQAAPALRGDATRRVNAARLRHLEERSAQVSERVADVFTAAEARVLGIAGGDDPDRWRSAIRGLAVRSVAGLDGARLLCRAPDAVLIADLDAVAAGSLERLGEDAAPGVCAWSADDRLEVDATLPVRLDRARRQLVQLVVEMLGLELEGHP